MAVAELHGNGIGRGSGGGERNRQRAALPNIGTGDQRQYIEGSLSRWE
jgi:hypothetical protein